MCAGLAHSVGRSWCGVINSPATTFAVIIKPARGAVLQRRGPFPKLLWADLFSYVLCLENAATSYNMDMGRVHPWVRSGWVKKLPDVHRSGWVGSISQNIFKICTLYMLLIDQPVVWTYMSVQELIPSLLSYSICGLPKDIGRYTNRNPL